MNLLKSIKTSAGFTISVCVAIAMLQPSVSAAETSFAERSKSIQRVADVALSARWHTVDSGNYKLETDLENLYTALYNTKNLPLKLIDNTKLAAQPVINILRQEGVEFGRTFSVQLDALMCDLNPEVCTRKRNVANTATLRTALGHVGGYKASRGKWSQNGSTPIVIPMIDFETGTAIIETSFKNGLLDEKTIEAQSSPNVVGVPVVDCSDWKRSCYEVVQRLNRAYFDPKRGNKKSTSTIKLPRAELITNIAIHELGTEGLSAKFKAPEYSKRLVSGNVNTGLLFSDAWEKSLSSTGSVELFTNALGSNMTSINYIKAQSSHENTDTTETLSPVGNAHETNSVIVEQPETPVPDVATETVTLDIADQEIFDLINHPLKNTETPFPDYLKRPIGITVFDFAFDNEHCGLSENVTVDAELWPTHQPQLDRQRAKHCGIKSQEPANVAHDHGTHVSGVITSNFGENGVLGHNPYAKLTYVALDKPAMRDDRYIKQIRRKIRDISLDQDLETTGIVNISWRYQTTHGGLTAMEQSIMENDEIMLFVVAAGNEGQKLTKEKCHVHPACFHTFDNVLTVVGLNRERNKPGIWIDDETGGSNTHPEFGIGAIADNVRSTVFGGYIAAMSGTSQAAPQVAAAASLIQSRFEEQFLAEQPRLLPIEIKNRLIYTSDFFPSMNGKLKGGRLNVLRALDMARAHLSIERDGALEHHGGNLFDVPPMGANPYIECLTGPEDTKLQIRLRHLRRLEYDKARRKYIVLYQNHKTERKTSLTRVNDCRLNTRYNVATFDSDEANGEISFQLRDIRSYISPMF